MRVCVIGAGAAGLCSIKRAVECRCEVTAFEQSTEIGGTWVLREEIVSDVHSSMYKGLRTDIPKEVMGFQIFRTPEMATMMVMMPHTFPQWTSSITCMPTPMSLA
jgi:dimethylaniline monooxygenase (N-oxide forming)